jgi:hypothetical protein
MIIQDILAGANPGPDTVLANWLIATGSKTLTDKLLARASEELGRTAGVLRRQAEAMIARGEQRTRATQAAAAAEARRIALGSAAPPAGFRAVAVASNGEGDILAVRSIPEPDAAAFTPSLPPGHAIKGVSTLMGADGTIRAQWQKTCAVKAEQWQLFVEACAEHSAKYKGLAKPLPAPASVDAELCALYPLGDPHIGMLSWHNETEVNFDLKIAEKAFVEGLDTLVSRTPAAKVAYLINVGDFFHAEGDAQVTPRGGHKLDVDCRKARVARTGFTLMRRMIDRLLQRHEQVFVVNARGNHDPEMALMLALWIEAVYEREPRVTVLGAENPYIYFEFGTSLIGIHHGDGAKMEALPQIMAVDRAEAWGKARFRYWLTGHIHHQNRKEFPGCVVESFRTMAARDYWHHQKGYRSGRSLESIVLHQKYGEFARFTVGVDEVFDEKVTAPTPATKSKRNNK